MYLYLFYIINNDLNNIGKVYRAESEVITLQSGQKYYHGAVDLPAGSYIARANPVFKPGKYGSRQVDIAIKNSDVVYMRRVDYTDENKTQYAGLCTTFSSSEQIQLSLVLYQNSGEDLSVTTSTLIIIKIK